MAVRVRDIIFRYLRLYVIHKLDESRVFHLYAYKNKRYVQFYVLQAMQ